MALNLAVNQVSSGIGGSIPSCRTMNMKRNMKAIPFFTNGNGIGPWGRLMGRLSDHSGYDMWSVFWRHWHSRAHKKAMRKSQRYAEIEEQLRTPNGLIRYDSKLFEERHQIFWEINRRPIYAVVHYWWDRHGIRCQWRNLKAFWQRGRNGWAKQDTWSLYSHFADVMIGSLSFYRDNLVGYPASLQNAEEWQAILDEIITGLKAGKEMEEAFDPAVEQELKNKFDKGMELLHEWWFALWD